VKWFHLISFLIFIIPLHFALLGLCCFKLGYQI